MMGAYKITIFTEIDVYRDIPAQPWSMLSEPFSYPPYATSYMSSYEIWAENHVIICILHLIDHGAIFIRS